MGTGLIIWLLVVAILNIATYLTWRFELRDKNNDGAFGEVLIFIVWCIVLTIIDISTAASLIF